MRSVVLSNRIRCLSQVAIISLIGALTAGCSGDSTRFDRALYSAVPKPAPNAYEKAVAENQQYPGDVDTITTAGISKNGAPVPLSLVGPRIVDSDDGMQYGASQRQQMTNYQQPIYQQPNYQAIPAYKPVAKYNPAPIYNSGVIRGTSLPQPSAIRQPIGLAAKRIAVDKINTASIRTTNVIKDTVSKKVITPIVKPVKAAVMPVAIAAKTLVAPVVTASVASSVMAQNSGGWSKIGGTTVQMGAGETLYNLSKRYGVPVNEIMAANAIGNAADLKVGQNVIIPTYVYSKSAPVSAPDNHPGTRAARASYGNLGQPRYSAVPAPSQRPANAKLAAIQTNNSAHLGVNHADANYNISRRAPVVVSTASTALNGGPYVVKSGDTLGRIAIQHGTSVSAIQSANGLNGTNIRVGQKLIISGVKTISRRNLNVSSLNAQKAKLDGISTGAISKVQSGNRIKNVAVNTTNSSLITKPTVSSVGKEIASVSPKTPKSSGIKSMRWPVNGRIVSKFGSKKNLGKNDGIDISVPEGTSVKAAENGIVIYSGSELAGFGNLILIRHDGGFVTAYAYNKSLVVQKGAEVRRGQVIARSGKTGDAETPMLHFEVRKNSRPVNPVTYLGS